MDELKDKVVNKVFEKVSELDGFIIPLVHGLAPKQIEVMPQAESLNLQLCVKTDCGIRSFMVKIQEKY